METINIMADLDKKNIITKLEEASLSNEKTSFLNQDISNLQLKKLNMTGHIFKKCTFYVTSFYGCVFTKCEFLDCNFSNADLLNVKFIDCTFVNCNFTETKLQDVLVEGGFKSNNIFKKLKIVGNVTGISEDDSDIISEETESIEDILNSFNILSKEQNEYLLKSSSNLLTLSISPDEEMGPNTWRITISSNINDEYDSIISDTIEFPCNKKELYESILNIINYAVSKIKRINNSELKTSILELLNKFKNINLKNLELEETLVNPSIEILEQKWDEIYTQITSSLSSTFLNSDKEFTFSNGDIKIEAFPIKTDNTFLIKINLIYLAEDKNNIISSTNFYIDEDTTTEEFINYIFKFLKHEARTTNYIIKTSILKLLEKWKNKK